MNPRIPSDDEILAAHPTEPVAVIDLGGHPAVVDRATGRTLCEFPEASSFCWCRGGAEFLLVRGDPDEHFLERRRWPDGLSLFKGPVFPTQCVNEVQAAPQGGYALVAGNDLETSTMAAVDLETLAVIPQARHSIQEEMTAIAVSPDARLVVGITESDPRPWPSPTQAFQVGTLCIGLAGKWEFLQVPILLEALPGKSIEHLNWPRWEYRHPARFLDDRRLRLTLPDGEVRDVDIEAMRTDARWIELNARRHREAAEERRSEGDRLLQTKIHNERYAKHALRLRESGLTCPHCGRHGTDLRVHPGTPEERAFFVCPGCGRSVDPDFAGTAPARRLGRLWIWLGASLLSAIAVVVGIGFAARGAKVYQSLEMIGGATFLAAVMLRQSRTESWHFWNLLPALEAREFRSLLIPHLAACSGGLVAAACLIIAGFVRSADRLAWIRSPSATKLFMGLTIGGTLLALGGILWGRRRRRALGLP